MAVFSDTYCWYVTISQCYNNFLEQYLPVTSQYFLSMPEWKCDSTIEIKCQKMVLFHYLYILYIIVYIIIFNLGSISDRIFLLISEKTPNDKNSYDKALMTMIKFLSTRFVMLIVRLLTYIGWLWVMQYVDNKYRHYSRYEI